MIHDLYICRILFSTFQPWFINTDAQKSWFSPVIYALLIMMSEIQWLSSILGPNILPDVVRLL